MKVSLTATLLLTFFFRSVMHRELIAGCSESLKNFYITLPGQSTDFLMLNLVVHQSPPGFKALIMYSLLGCDTMYIGRGQHY